MITNIEHELFCLNKLCNWYGIEEDLEYDGISIYNCPNCRLPTLETVEEEIRNENKR